MILETFIPDFAFSSALSDITILDATEDVFFVLSYKQPDESYKNILSELYTPDRNAKIEIIDLQKIIDGYLMEIPTGDFKFSFTSGTSVTEFESHILLSHAELDTDVTKFVSQRFLTLIYGNKTTHPESLEILSVYTLEANENVTVEAIYRNDTTGSYDSKVFDIDAPIVNRITGLNVSPTNYTAEGKTLVRYTVNCGSRKMNYLVDNLFPPPPLELIFTNNFGVPETFSTAGTLASERKYENQFGKIKGAYNKYNISFHKEMTANTGIMDQPTADWIESELFSSYFVFIVKDRVIGKAITITDQTVKRNSDKTEQPAFEFKYRISQRNQEVIEFGKYLYMIFDETFDKTFN